MSKTLIVNDPRGVMVATWRKEQFCAARGTKLEVSPLGQVKANGKLLALTGEQVQKLIVTQRVRVEG
jgi:hypothetical protein